MATTTTTNVTVSQVNIASQRATVEAQFKALVNGIKTELANVDSFVISGVTFTKQELVDKFQGRLDAAERTKTARTALHALVAQERQVQADVAKIRTGFKICLQGRLGKNSPELQKFGFTQAKTPQRPVANKAAGIEKSKATRQARHTTGKKAKLKITGTPPATETAATAQAQPAATTAPPAASPAPATAPRPTTSVTNGSTS
jgi:hypothetical protein